MVNAQAKRKKRQRDRVNAKAKKAGGAPSVDSLPPTTAKTTNSSIVLVSSTASSHHPTNGNGSLLKTNTNATSMVAGKGGNVTATSATTIPAKPYVVGASCSHKKFLTPQDGPEFTRLVDEKYRGFVHVAANQVTPSNFHQQAKAALERLRDANYYQYDIVMAGGRHSSRTFVKRTLVGNPGITYKYLGLRLFAHAWSGPGVSPLLKSISDMNEDMIRMTKEQKRKVNYHTDDGVPDDKCSDDYNLTLINYMEPSSHTKIGFKDEAFYGMGKVSVSWHADSSLEDYSSIGVYHCLPTQKATKWDWRIALRPIPPPSSSSSGAADDGKPTGNDAPSSFANVPPVVVPTKDGDAYFLFGTFNHTHQHCVLAGTVSNRISSTHRVAVTKEDTHEYIARRVRHAIKIFQLQIEGKKKASLWNPTKLSDCQQALTEVEMDWIAQYWLQGSQHDVMHVWWQRPIKVLEAQWVKLEEWTYRVYQMCLQDTARVIPREVVHGLLTELTARQKLRLKWDERRADKIYQRRIATEFRPVARPIFPVKAPSEDASSQPQQRLPKDLSSAIRDLSRILSKYGPVTEEGTNTGTTRAITKPIGQNTSAKNGTKQPLARPNVISEVGEDDDDKEPPNKKPRHLVSPARSPATIVKTVMSPQASLHPQGNNTPMIKNESNTSSGETNGAKKKRKKSKTKKVPLTRAA